MLQRQIEEAADVAPGRKVVPGFQRPQGEHPRERIGGEGVAGIPEDVARELVQQDQQGQRSLRSLRPVIQLTARREEMRGLEPLAEPGVESLILGEPLRGPGLFPEGDDVGRRYVCAHEPEPRYAAARLP